MVAFEAVIGSGGVAVVMVSGREDAGGVGLGRGAGGVAQMVKRLLRRGVNQEPQ